MPIQASASIRARLMRMNLIVVIVSIALSLAGTLYFTLRSEQRALDNNLLNSASILSRVPLLICLMRWPGRMPRWSSISRAASIRKSG